MNESHNIAIAIVLSLIAIIALNGNILLIQNVYATTDHIQTETDNTKLHIPNHFIEHLQTNEFQDYTECSNNDIHKIEKYINSIKTLESNFTQIDSNGDIQNGKLYIIKPGKLRIDYTIPKKISIIINKEMMTYHDYELNETTNAPSDSILSTLLTNNNINFFNDYQLIKAYIKRSKTNYPDASYIILIKQKDLSKNESIKNNKQNNIQHSKSKLSKSINSAQMQNISLMIEIVMNANNAEVSNDNNQVYNKKTPQDQKMLAHKITISDQRMLYIRSLTTLEDDRVIAEMQLTDTKYNNTIPQTIFKFKDDTFFNQNDNESMN